MRAVLSCDAVTMRVPSGLKAAAMDGSSWPLTVADRLAARGVPDARRLVGRRGDDALAVGAERCGNDGILMAFERSPIGWPLAASQMRACCQDAVTMRVPSGLNSARNSPHGRGAAPIGLPVAASQMRAVLSKTR